MQLSIFGEIHGEFDAMILYAAQFISLSTMEYQSVWWRLFHALNSSEWSNVFSLLLSLPVSNGRLEQTFSLIKSNKRTPLTDCTLSDLLTVNADKLPLQDFSPDAAINLWWDAMSRKPSHGS